jgi:riboflavin kinase / FMN adenylyltransferase
VQLIRDLTTLPDRLRGGAVAIGNFDGVHLGHARIVERLLASARSVAGPAIVFTFDPHPVRLLRPAAAPPPLTWTDRKAQLLAALGVDAVIAYPTDEELLQLAPADFFHTIVVKQLAARAMIEGPNFYFGHNRTGTIEVLRTLTSAASMSLEVVPPVEMAGDIVSSSRVRALIAAGKIAEADALLTQPYRIRGMVVHGAGRGVKLGFGTANIDAIDTLLPAPGVYAGRVELGGAQWIAAIHIGPNSTFGEHALKVEVHLVGWHEPLYGQPLEVDFLKQLRGTQRFDGIESLKAQLELDVAAAIAVNAQAGPKPTGNTGAASAQ